MSKSFVVDSSVFLSAPYALRCFADNRVIIPTSVIREVAEVARKGGAHHREAVTFIRTMDELLTGPGHTIDLEEGGQVIVMDDEAGNDNIYTLSQRQGATIVTHDPAVRVMARYNGVAAEPFKHDQELLTDYIYTGRCTLYVSEDEFQTYCREGSLTIDPKKDYTATAENGDTISEAHKLMPNEYVILVSSSDPAKSKLGRYDSEAKQIIPLAPAAMGDSPVFGVLPRNVGQKFALDALLNDRIPLVILRGPAGTAKSFLSMAAGLQQVMENQSYKKCLLTRPNTKMDNDIGYLKGDETDKIMPILRGLLDNIDNLIDIKGTKSAKELAQQPGNHAVDTLMGMGVVEMQSLAYMRGRSIVGQYIVADEMQNSTPTQALSIITRAGERTKIVICGNTEQIDVPYMDCHSNGLVYAAERMKESPLCAQITFSEKESTRSPLARDAIRLMGPNVGE